VLGLIIFVINLTLVKVLLIFVVVYFKNPVVKL